MSSSAFTDWNTGSKSGLVNIGSHNLWLSTHGPNRTPNQPLAIIIPGLGSSTKGFAALQRLLTPFVRILEYERSGYPPSDIAPPPSKPAASTIAKELDLLLENAGLVPPFIIVAHSWGGIISREFLDLRGEGDVVGMVFIEANQERTLEVLDWRGLAGSPLLRGVEYFEATGIVESHKLSGEEWRVYREFEGTEEVKRQAGLEVVEYPNGFPVLGAKAQLQREVPLLGDNPVCVIKGDNRGEFEKLLNAGLARGNGDEAEEAKFREVLGCWDDKDRGLQSEILRLSGKSRFIETTKSGHYVQLTEPELVVAGVRWILEQLDENKV